MIETLTDIIQNHGLKHWSIFAKKDMEFSAWVNEQTQDMATATFPERVYAATTGTRPLCECGKGNRKLISITKGWSQFCGRPKDCEAARQYISETVSHTRLMVPVEERQALAKKSLTTLQSRNNGISNAGQLKVAKLAHQAFYSDPVKVSQVVAKVKATMLMRHGVANALQLPKVYAYRKALASSLTPEQKRIAVEKRRKKSLAGSLLEKSYEKIVEKCHRNHFGMLTPQNQYFGVGRTGFRHKYDFFCHRCELMFFDYLYDGHLPSCPKCDAAKRARISKEQKSVALFIESLGFEVINNVRKLIPDMELDIVVESKKIAIEYGGLYWHVEPRYDELYHQRKLKRTEERGYRLITIFSDEWLLQRAKCEARLRNIFGLAERVSARKTKVVLIEAKVARKFLDKHHIQGYGANSSVHFGLIYNDELISVMAFRKKDNFATKLCWELYRFASSVNVVGGASKLFTAFVREYDPMKVMSYCDRRWGTGGVYKNLGFEFVGQTRPNYFWVEKYKIRHSRKKFMKKLLVKHGWDASMTEDQIMKEKGFDRISDCGNNSFRWKKNVSVADDESDLVDDNEFDTE